MFCPECRAEYRPGFTECKDCGLPLVVALEVPRQEEPPESPRPPDNPVEIARFIDVRQADFAVSVLEGSGIEAYIDIPFVGNLAPHYMWASGGIGVFVGSLDKERALDVLESSEELKPEDRADVGNDT